MRDDIAKLLKGPSAQEKNFYVLCALTDFQNLLKQCQKPKEQNASGGKRISLNVKICLNNNSLSGFSKQFPNDQFPQVQHETKEKIKKYLKKTDYFLSFAKDVLKM